jgi:uncharacterized protein
VARVEIRPFLMPDGAGGHRFCLLQSPAGRAPTTLVLHAQALGGELNLARRQVSLTARAWAEAGAAVLIVDLAGCGDSSGDEPHDPWSAWSGDLRRAARWLRAAWPGRPLWGWALRGGSLAMAGAWLDPATPGDLQGEPEGAAEGPDHWLMWQPMLDGDDLQRHWQRQALAAALAEGREGAAATAAMRDAWARGETVDVAGTPVSPALARGARDRSLLRPAAPSGPGPGRLVWIDVQPQVRDTPAPRTATCLAAWRSAGWQADWQSVPGSAFWLGPEVTTLPALTAATLEATARQVAPGPDTDTDTHAGATP